MPNLRFLRVPGEKNYKYTGGYKSEQRNQRAWVGHSKAELVNKKREQNGQNQIPSKSNN